MHITTSMVLLRIILPGRTASVSCRTFSKNQRDFHGKGIVSIELIYVYFTAHFMGPSIRGELF